MGIQKFVVVVIQRASIVFNKEFTPRSSPLGGPGLGPEFTPLDLSIVFLNPSFVLEL